MEWAIIAARSGMSTAISVIQRKARTLKKAGELQRATKWEKAGKALETARVALEEILNDLEEED
jgi:hypothetical protein